MSLRIDTADPGRPRTGIIVFLHRVKVSEHVLDGCAISVTGRIDGKNGNIFGAHLVKH